MKKRYENNEITYDLLHRHVNEEIAFHAFGMTGSRKLMKDSFGDLFFEYERVDGSVNQVPVMFNHDTSANSDITAIEVDEKIEVDWNEVIEHPIIVPVDVFYGKGGIEEEMMELNEMLHGFDDGNHFDYSYVTVNDDTNFITLYFYTRL